MDDSTGLEQMVCFELYAASRAVTGLYRPALEAAGLTYPQYVALRVIWHRGRVTVGDLGAALDLDSGTLSPLLKRLESQGSIRRERGTDDERVVWVSSTEQGEQLRRQLADLPERLACALDFEPADFGILLNLLGRIRGTSATTL